jgi:hypothetical protein
MRLLPLRSFRPERGYAWFVDLPDSILPGEGLGRVRASSLRVFEDSRELGPASAVHDEIRTVGLGRFSHWGRGLMLSTSDNSNPNENRRAYFVVAPEPGHDVVSESKRNAGTVADDPEALRECLSRSLSTQGAEFHSAYSLRTLLSVLKDLDYDLAAKTVLEIGASPTHGLGIALGLLGAAKVILNNVQPMAPTVSMAYATNVEVLTSLITPLSRRLSDVVTPLGDAKLATLNSAVFDVVSSTDAAALPIFKKTLDLVFSFSVLEHIRHLPDVLGKLRSAIAPDGLSVHWIDLRDHTDFDDPLKFLRIDEAEFLARYDTAHNRWRRSEYIRMFKQAGWEVVRERFGGQLPTLSTGGTDMLAAAAKGPERVFVSDPRDLLQDGAGVYDDLSLPYRNLPREELSIMVLEVIAKPS